MTNYQAVNRQSSKGLTSVSCVSLSPLNKPVPFQLLPKRLGCCEFAVYTDCPRGDGSVPPKGYTPSLQGRGSAVHEDYNQLVIIVQKAHVCVCVEDRPIEGLD